jgi:hypothetical protein
VATIVWCDCGYAIEVRQDEAVERKACPCCGRYVLVVAKQGERGRPTLNMPPFPRLTWDQCFWVGTLSLEFWRGFQSCQGPYASFSSEEPSDGTVRINVSPSNNETAPPSLEQIRSFQHFLDNQMTISESVLKAIFAEYPAFQDFFGEDDLLMPRIHQPEDLKKLIGLSTIHVLSIPKDGFTGIGFEFGCSWDQEHGLGVLAHKGNVLVVGAAELSFHEHPIRERD